VKGDQENANKQGEGGCRHSDLLVEVGEQHLPVQDEMQQSGGDKQYSYPFV
jgi:hypothetical protein